MAWWLGCGRRRGYDWSYAWYPACPYFRLASGHVKFTHNHVLAWHDGMSSAGEGVVWSVGLAYGETAKLIAHMFPSRRKASDAGMTTYGRGQLTRRRGHDGMTFPTGISRPPPRLWRV